MNCAYCEERLSDYIENALSPAERGPLDLHFASCAACSELLGDVRRLMESRMDFPTHAAPDWLAPRIIANTPQIVRETWIDPLRGAWQWLMAPRTAMVVFTATLVLGWLGGQAGVTPQTIAQYRNPAAIYEQAGGFINGAYNAVIRAYYRSPLVSTIQCRIEQLREIS